MATGPEMGRVLFAVTGWDASPWLEAFARLAPQREIVRESDAAGDASIRYAVVWKPKAGVLSKLPGLAAIFSVGAGVDHILSDPELPNVPIVRMVADDLTDRMSEYVVWQVLDHLRQGPRYRLQQTSRIWRELSQPVAADVTVGILGLGVLGSDAAAKLATMGFRLAGWSRSRKAMDGIECFHGERGLPDFLGTSDIVVCLLPLTPGTLGMIGHDFIAMMKRETPLGGPVLINAGRGGLQVEADLLEALDGGKLMAASLDVFETEPLPAGSRLWDHPAVTVTPHAAAMSDPRKLVRSILRQMADFEAGMPLVNLVDREAGY